MTWIIRHLLNEERARVVRAKKLELIKRFEEVLEKQKNPLVTTTTLGGYTFSYSTSVSVPSYWSTKSLTTLLSKEELGDTDKGT